VPPQANPAELPVDLMRRIPVQAEAYQRWLSAWGELRDSPGGELKPVAERHRFSVRQLEFIRRAGEAGLLDSPIPPAVRLTTLTQAGRQRATAPHHTP
jgi:hypothetical protein